MDTVICAQDLTRIFRVKQKAPGLKGSLTALIKPTYHEICAVGNLSFAIERGERIAMIGPNGAGKSTTLKMLVGILHPTTGSVEVLGHLPWKERRQLAVQIGVLFGQKSQLWYHLSAQDSFDLLAQIYQINRNHYKNRLKDLVESFDIGPLLKTPVRKLSLGQRMRCEIAASLLHSPKILFLDEPTIGLDVVVKQQLRDLILQLSQREGVTVLLASHDVGDVEALCHRALVINEGCLIYDGTLNNLKSNYICSRTISLKFAQPIEAIRLDGVRVLKQEEYNALLEVDLTRCKIEHVLSELLARYPIMDILITMPTMETIIREIFQTQARK